MDNESHFFRCSNCGNLVTTMNKGSGKMFCCGQLMSELPAREEGLGMKEHLPEILHEGTRLTVRVQGGEHPAEKGHRILWIMLRTPHRTTIRYLREGAKTEVHFPDVPHGIIYVYCSIHKLWRKSF